MYTRKRYVFAFMGVLLGAVVLASCSGDAVIEETNDQAAIEEGLYAWRTAVVEQAKADRSAAIKSGLREWRQAATDHIRLAAAVQVEQLRANSRIAGDALRLGTTVESGDRAVEIEQLRAEARAEGDALRLGSTVDSGDRAVEIEQLRAEARAEGDALRLGSTVDSGDRAVEIEQLRSQARVEGDRLRSPSNAAVLWTEAGSVEVDMRVWADALAPRRATSGGHLRIGDNDRCVGPRVITYSPATTSVNARVGQCDGLAGIWVDPPPRVVMSALSFEQAERIPWALDLFERSGLELPTIRFVGQQEPGACSGKEAAARHDETGTQILICRRDTGPTWDWLLLHEIGHAWSQFSSEQSRRDLFLSVRSLASWRGGAWHERGAEHASEVLVWGLMDRPVAPGHIDNNSCMELLIAYRALTGLEPLHGYQQRCQ